MRRKIVLACFLVAMLFALTACKEPQEVEKQNQQEQWDETGLSQTMSQNVDYFNAGVKFNDLIVKGEDAPYYCNLEENMRWGMNEYQVLVCKDPVYDITYYVNYGRDYYIYALREGSAELAVKLPGRELYCRNGALYFIVDTYGMYTLSDVTEGDIIKYNPVDGSTECVISKGASTMVVYPDGICYKILGETEVYGTKEEEYRITPEESFYFSFETKRITPFPKSVNVMERWKEDYFSVVTERLPESSPSVQKMRDMGYTGDLYVNVRVDVTDKDWNVKTSLQGRDGLPAAYWLCGNEMYYIEERNEADEHRCVLVSENLETGIQRDVIMLDFPVLYPGDDFIILNDTLYFGTMFRVSLNDGSRCYAQSSEDSAAFSKMDALYTDGESVFCLCNDKLWILKEEKSAPVAVREFIEGYPLEIGAYLYELQSPENRRD